MFDVVLDVLAEKYGHSKDEMLATLAAHPSYQSLPRHPVLDSLGYFGEGDLPAGAAAAVACAAAETEPVATAAAAATAEATEAPPPKKVVVRRKKLKAPAAST